MISLRTFIYITIATLGAISHNTYSQSVSKINKLISRCQEGDQSACKSLSIIVKNENNPIGQFQAIKGITDQSVLIEVACSTKNNQLLLTALDKITDQQYLLEFVSKHIDESGLHALRNIDDLEKSKILLSKFIKSGNEYDPILKQDKKINYHDFYAKDSDPRIWAYEPVFKKYFKKLFFDIRINYYVRTYTSNHGAKENVTFKDYDVKILEGDQLIFSQEYKSFPPQGITLDNPDTPIATVTSLGDPFYKSDGGQDDVIKLIFSRIPENEYLYVYENLVSDWLRNLMNYSSFHIKKMTKEMLNNGFSTITTPPIITEGLLSYYTFDYKHSNKSYINDYDGIHGGSISKDVPGKAGYSMQFFYHPLHFSKAFFPSINKEWTISFWIKTCSNDFVIYCQNDKKKSNYISINSSNKLEVNNSLNGIFSNDLSESLLNNQWHMLSITRDSKMILKYFIDSKLQESMSSSWDWGGSSTIIGGNSDHNNYFFVGKMDNLRIYDRVLSQEEILQIFDAVQ